MKNNALKDLLFKRFSVLDLFLSLLAYIAVGLLPSLKNAPPTDVTRLGDGGNPFDN